ncbi:hypothetical protein IMSHALPRED_001532 [Imshaugia aleurites]|uniref:Uncharacterized protein n=1 Tax=Imshaugia aleurites TaxID=172621 RepID=A0A8H3PFJ0_9LECA|nr:hypothetical protein IMSHALPRED_001532 [Imshaugia aleurites]
MWADQDCYSGLWSYDSYTNGSYINGSWSNVSWFTIQPGSMHTKVTRAYAPEALSTGGDCYGKSWAAINYTKLYSPLPDYEVITEAACSRQGYRVSKGQSIDSSYFLAGDALLSMPPDLSLIDPLWSTCTAETLGGYDPPIALSAVKALVPGPTTTPDPPPHAKPAPSPTHSLPVQTLTSEPNTPAEGQPLADGTGFDPSNASNDPMSKIGEALAPTPGSNPADPGDQGQEGTPAAASPQQGAGHGNSIAGNPYQESGAQDEDSSQIPGPAGAGQQSAPVSAEAQQDEEGDSPSNKDSHQESGIQGEGSPAVDISKTDDLRGVSMVVGTHTILVDTSGTSLDGAALDPEGSPVTISGAAAVIQANSIIIGDSIIHLPSPAADSPTLIAQYTVTPLAGAVVIAGETLHAGDLARTIAGTLISLDSNDNLALNPTVQALPTPPPPGIGLLVDGQTTDIDGRTIEVLSNGLSIAGTTFTSGGPAATLSGTPVSLGRTALVIDGSTIPVSLATPSPLITAIGGQVITAAPSSVILQGTSLEPGAPGITIDNTLISLNKAGSLILGSRTIALGGTHLTTQIGDDLITAAATGVQIAGSTLLPGAAGWTIDGTKISLDAMGDVVIGAKTIALDGEGEGLGGLILAGMGSNGVAESTSSSFGRASGSVGGAGTGGQVFEGKAGRLEAMGLWIVAALVVLTLSFRT